MVEPLCPECRKKMAAHWTCDHCGFDPNRTKSKERLVVLPYNCVRCQKPTQKKIDDIPVCGDCFTEGYGRLPDMPLSPPLREVIPDPDFTPIIVSPGDKDFVDSRNRIIDKILNNDTETPKETKTYKCPKCHITCSTNYRLNKHKTKFHGG